MTEPKLPAIDINDYRYELPDERIARHPLAQRDASKLLVWKKVQIEHRRFSELPELLQGNEILFFNNTRVIPARLFFHRSTGARIEVFLLHPLMPASVEAAMRAIGECVWECTIGNLKRWPEETALSLELKLAESEPPVRLTAYLENRASMRVRFTWDNSALPFVKIVEAAGAMPIPPYLDRPVEEADKTDYQTVYGSREGAVAAPTAGLHFTPVLLERLEAKGIQREELTLHVSAGTFKPVKTENALDHDMHREQLMVTRRNVEALATGRPVVAVGTTSMRTLESLYWFAVKLRQDPEADFSIEKLFPYRHPESGLPTLPEAAKILLGCLDRRGLEELHGATGILLFPGYRFRVCDALVTNFHQPGSTLLLLVAAFTGGENWKKIYAAAQENGYRFLSYGDSSLLYR